MTTTIEDQIDGVYTQTVIRASDCGTFLEIDQSQWDGTSTLIIRAADFQAFAMACSSEIEAQQAAIQADKDFPV